MADPNPFVPGYSYSGWQADNPTKPLPAPQIDNDLANAAQSTQELVDAVKDVRRSDGALKNEIVTLDTLAPDVRLLMNVDPTFASQIATVAGIDTEIATVAGIDTDVQAVAGMAAEIAAIGSISGSIQIVAGIASDVTAVAAIDSDVATIAANIADIQAAPQHAQDAADARDKAQLWAEAPENTAVEPGKYSAYHWSEKAKNNAEGYMPSYTPLNMFGDGGRFAGDPEPKSVSASNFTVPSYISTTNGSSFSAGPKFIHNNNDYGGSAGALDADVKSLIDKLKAPTVRRYGIEFYLMHITAGAGTTGSATINGIPHYYSFILMQAPILGKISFNCHILVKSGSVGFTTFAGSSVYLDGVAQSTSQQIVPADGWRQISRHYDRATNAFTGYDNTLHRIYSTPGTEYYLAIPFLATGTIPMGSGVYYGAVPSYNAWQKTLVKADVGLGNVDNTSDANKPVSTAQQLALDDKTEGPASSAGDEIALFDGISGKILKTGVPYAASATASTVALRGTGGVLSVGAPTDDAHAATKKYVDDNSGGFGVGQTWQDVSSSRSHSTSYQNTTGKGIFVYILYHYGAGTQARFQVSSDGSSWIDLGVNNIVTDSEDPIFISIAIPDTGYYRLQRTVGSGSVSTPVWSELR